MLAILIATCCHSTIYAIMSNQIFGLTEEEVAQLKSDDKEFYGLSKQPLLMSASGDDLESKGEELGDRGILPECELQERISIVVRENCKGTVIRKYEYKCRVSISG